MKAKVKQDLDDTAGCCVSLLVVLVVIALEIFGSFANKSHGVRVGTIVKASDNGLVVVTHEAALKAQGDSNYVWGIHGHRRGRLAQGPRRRPRRARGCASPTSTARARSGGEARRRSSRPTVAFVGS